MKIKRALALFLILSLLVLQLLNYQISSVFALNDTTKTWTFSLSTTGDYTKSQIDGETVMAVDDNGAHPTGGTVGANELTNPGFASGSEGGDADNWSVAAVPPSGWVEVPGNSSYYEGNYNGNFLVMKYEAKCDATSDGIGDTSQDTGYKTWPDNTAACTSANGRVVVSSTAGYPIANISRDTAKTRCAAVTLNGNATHLITNPEWMTLARNAEAQSSNWSLGCSEGVCSGYLFAGHNNNNGGSGYALQASTTDTGNYRCAYTDSGGTVENPSSCPSNTAYGQSGSGENQVRTLTLSNGSVIWDTAGNVWDHVMRDSNDTLTPQNQTPHLSTAADDGAGIGGWGQFSEISDYGALSDDIIRPSNSSYDNSSYGVGRLWTWGDDETAVTNRVFLRGGRWDYTSNAGAFTLVLLWG